MRVCVIGALLVAASAAQNLSYDIEFTFRRNDNWPMPNGTRDDFVNDLRHLGGINNPAIPAEYSANVSVLWDTALLRVYRGGSGGPDPFAVCQRVVNTIAPQSAFWTKYGLVNCSLGYTPVDVPRWLRVELVKNDMIFTVLGVVGALLVAAQGAYGAQYYFTTRGGLRKRNTEQEA